MNMGGERRRSRLRRHLNRRTVPVLFRLVLINDHIADMGEALAHEKTETLRSAQNDMRTLPAITFSRISDQDNDFVSQRDSLMIRGKRRLTWTALWREMDHRTESVRHPCGAPFLDRLHDIARDGNDEEYIWTIHCQAFVLDVEMGIRWRGI